MNTRKWLISLVVCTLLSGCGLIQTGEVTSSSTTGQSASETSYPVHETETSSFYYDQLSDEQKSIYETLMRAKDAYASHVDFNLVSKDDFTIAFQAFLYDNPLVFYGQSYTWTGYQDGSVISSIDYSETGDYESITSQIQQAAQQVIDAMPADLDTYGKVKYFYEWIITNTDYGSSEYDQDVRSVFLDHVSVCSGYAKAFKLLCDMAGIPCEVVQGTASGEAHAWNLVTIDGVDTWVDPTWGDPVYLNAEDISNINYNYLCVPDDLLFLSHTIDTSAGSGDDAIADVFTYPACTDWSYEYYVRNSCYFDSYNRLSLYSWFSSQVNAGRTSDIAFQYADDASYQTAVEDLFGSGAYIRTIVQQWYSSVTIRYETDDTLRVISVTLE
jgi:hypothetical protein